LSLLERTPFRDYFVPSLVLFFVVGGSMAVAAILVLTRAKGSRLAAAAAGTIVVGWIVAQVAFIGWMSWLQPVTAVAGLLVTGLALALPESGPRTHRRDPSAERTWA
jgi:hypothetical protein